MFRDGSSIPVILPLHTPIRDPGSSGWASAGSTVLPAITTRPARRQRRRSKNPPVSPLGPTRRETTHTELWGDWHGVMERPPSTPPDCLDLGRGGLLLQRPRQATFQVTDQRAFIPRRLSGRRSPGLRLSHSGTLHADAST